MELHYKHQKPKLIDCKRSTTDLPTYERWFLISQWLLLVAKSRVKRETMRMNNVEDARRTFAVLTIRVLR